MNNWNQQPSNNQSSEGNGPPRTGGLLSNYNRQQPAGPTSPKYQPGSGLNAGPAMPTQQGSGLLSSHRSGVVANTMQVMRSWSGKMAAMTGYTYRPPEPPLERYHPQTGGFSEPSQPLSQKPWRRSRTVRIVRKMRNRRDRWERTKPNAGRVLTSIFIALLLIVLISSFSGTAYGYNYYQSQLPQLQRIANAQISQTTRIYDRNGVLLDERSEADRRRIPVFYQDIPQIMQDAMISTEDKTFWDNAGVDPLAIFRSATQGNGGASGLTQQVIKNLTGQKQYSLDRKISEASLSIALTQEFPKWKIMEMYFNVASFDAQDYGVEAAVEEYFGLQPKCDLNFKCIPGLARLDYESDANPHNALLALARASLLAGMPQNPVSYDPTRNDASKQRALARQIDVLDLMVVQHRSYGPGLVTPAIAKQAEDLTAKMTFTPYHHAQHAQHFVEWIIGQVEESLGVDGANAFLTGGFNIRTTIDADLEDYVERAVKRHITQPEVQKLTGKYITLNNPAWNVNNGAVVVMDAKTGEILAMDGSTDYNSTDAKVNGQFNVATHGRPPGSTFKPIVYATAFEMGWYPGIVLPDSRTYFPNGSSNAGTRIPNNDKDVNGTLFAPYDYGHGYSHSQSSIQYATANSYNIPALKAMSFAGPDNVLATAHRLGITSQHLTGGISWGIGATDAPLIQMAGAYQVFADNGQRVPPQGVLDIWDNFGHQLYHYDTSKPPTSQVLTPQVSYMMTSVLIDEPSRNAEFKSDHDLSFADIDAACANVSLCEHQVAAKTGTTDEFRDNWTLGYTSNVVVGVWVGNADNSPMQGVIGISGAAPIWHSVMERVNGICNNDIHGRNYLAVSDKIDCGNYKSPYTIGKFAVPSGLHMAQTNTVNGLRGGGAAYLMLDGEDPMQDGIIQNPDPNNQNGATPGATATPTN